MSVGDVVWAVIGAAWVVWLALTAARPALAGIVRLVRALVGSWLGRFVALAAWGGAGWHLFCQHP